MESVDDRLGTSVHRFRVLLGHAVVQQEAVAAALLLRVDDLVVGDPVRGRAHIGAQVNEATVFQLTSILLRWYVLNINDVEGILKEYYLPNRDLIPKDPVHHGDECT